MTTAEDLNRFICQKGISQLLVSDEGLDLLRSYLACVDAPKTSPNFGPYYETLGDVIAAIERCAIDHKAELIGDWRERFEIGYTIGYEQNRSESFELASYRGRPTRRRLQASIYRMPSGRYELTTYYS